MFLTRRGCAVVALVDPEQLDRLGAYADELADIRAVGTAWEGAEELRETPMPWDGVMPEVGLAGKGPAQPARA